jgi:ribosome-associated protein
MKSTMELGQIAASAAIDKKSSKITLLDVRGFTDMCDITLICSADNEKQAQAIFTEIEDRCRKVAGLKPLSVEGQQIGNWILMDYGALVVHIFLAAVRDFYAFDNLWPKAKVLPSQG